MICTGSTAAVLLDEIAQIKPFNHRIYEPYQIIRTYEFIQ